MSEDNLTQLEKQSIQAALTQDWNKASTLNQKILKIDDKNIEALNRLAKAKIELRIFDEAKAILEKVLNLDKFNSIAKANLERAQRTQTKKTKADFSTSISKIQIVSFIEEPGKTKTVEPPKEVKPDSHVQFITARPATPVNSRDRNR